MACGNHVGFLLLHGGARWKGAGLNVSPEVSGQPSDTPRTSVLLPHCVDLSWLRHGDFVPYYCQTDSESLLNNFLCFLYNSFTYGETEYKNKSLTLGFTMCFFSEVRY